MIRSSLKRAFSVLGVLVIAASFVGLGIWQLNRARESQVPVVVNSTVVPLASITQPRIALPLKAALRHVQVSGHYIADYQAPFQVDGQGQTGTWEVGLLAADSHSAILVVRGLWSDRNNLILNSSNVVTVTGKLMPHQNDDVTQSHKTVLSRLDSALVVNQTSLDLYDGFVIADSEALAGTNIVRMRITPPTPKSAVPGFYWQHLSYVVIWWFMAGVVLYLPFYQRRVTQHEI
ncbi:MAG TPA: SURF1 family cytochrome oxidase biogenesis protein [Candidatus Nanopelagicaceae bacterium]